MTFLSLFHSTQRPTIPETCDSHLADLIRCCWQQDAKVTGSVVMVWNNLIPRFPRHFTAVSLE